MSEYIEGVELCIKIDVLAVEKRMFVEGLLDVEYFEDPGYCVPELWGQGAENSDAGYMVVDGETQRAWLYIDPQHTHWGGASLIEVVQQAQDEWCAQLEANIVEMLDEKKEEVSVD